METLTIKEHANLKALLDDFTIKILTRWMNGDHRSYEDFSNDYAMSNTIKETD
jgi:hypothetical protein